MVLRFELRLSHLVSRYSSTGATLAALGLIFPPLKNVIGILMGIALNIQIAFGSIAIFTNINSADP
jgi:hypothetical protein